MEKSLTFLYHKEGVLHVDINGARPYLGQESNHLNGDEIVARSNPTTGEVENLEIIFFKERIHKEGYIDMFLTPYPRSMEWGDEHPDDKRLTFRYDRMGDIFRVDIDSAQPHPGQQSDEIGDGVIARFNPITGDVENFEISFFNERIRKEGTLKIDLTPDAEIIAANKAQSNGKDTLHNDSQGAQSSESVNPAQIATDC